MVYECDQCSAALPAGAHACPRCGEAFEEAVPPDAVLPKAGFHAAASSAAPDAGGIGDAGSIGDADLRSKLAQAEADIATLRSQAIVLKSEVMTLRGHVATLTGEVTAVEEHSAALKTYSATLQSQVVTLTNRLTVLEMAGREDKRRFIDHVNHVKEALGYIQLNQINLSQINGPTGAPGQ